MAFSRPEEGEEQGLLKLFLIVVSGAGDKHRYLAAATSTSQLTKGKIMQGKALRARLGRPYPPGKGYKPQHYIPGV